MATVSDLFCEKLFFPGGSGGLELLNFFTKNLNKKKIYLCCCIFVVVFFFCFFFRGGGGGGGGGG